MVTIKQCDRKNCNEVNNIVNLGLFVGEELEYDRYERVYSYKDFCPQHLLEYVKELQLNILNKNMSNEDLENFNENFILKFLK